MNGKVTLFRRLATWGKDGPVSKNQLQRFCSIMNVFKGRIIWGWGSESSLSSTAGSLSSDWLVVRQPEQVVFQESCVQAEVSILHLGGGLTSCRRTQRYCYTSVYSLRKNQDPAPKAALLFDNSFLIASVLLLHPLPSLISNSLNLLFGTQGRSRRLDEASFLQIRNRRPRKDI